MASGSHSPPVPSFPPLPFSSRSARPPWRWSSASASRRQPSAPPRPSTSAAMCCRFCRPIVSNGQRSRRSPSARASFASTCAPTPSPPTTTSSPSSRQARGKRSPHPYHVEGRGGAHAAPPISGRALYPAEVQTLRDWNRAGRALTEHWAFVPSQRAPLPAVRDAKWPQTPSNRFVARSARCRKTSPPAPRASRATLIRRATSTSPGGRQHRRRSAAVHGGSIADAYSKLVDRLLASPHFWRALWPALARLARYADSGGFETDIFFRPRLPASATTSFRAFNADKPFDRVIKEQMRAMNFFPAMDDARVDDGFYTTGPVLQEPAWSRASSNTIRTRTSSTPTGARLSWADVRLRPLPRSQIRSFFAEGVLLAPGDLRGERPVRYSVDGKKLRDRAALQNSERNSRPSRPAPAPCANPIRCAGPRSCARPGDATHRGRPPTLKSPRR